MVILLAALGCVENTFETPSETITPPDDTAPPCPPGMDCTEDSPQDSPVDSPVDSDPPDCEVELVPGASIPTLDECAGTTTPPVTDPWDVEIEWQWTSGDSYYLPLIGNLSDDNGDGKIDENDIPDVVVVSMDGVLHVLDGETGAEHWSKSGHSGYAVGTLADVDGDNVTDIISITSSGKLQALDYNGNTIWTSSQGVTSTHPLAVVSDLDEDGLPEVLIESYVFNGEDGSLDWTASTTGSIPYHGATAADLDQDGDKEAIFQNKVYDSSGSLLWTSSVQGSYGHWPVILQYDTDPEGEVAMVGGGKLAIYDHDGTERVNVSAGTSQPGPPCLADFDGDGEAEIAWPSSSSFNMYELDGTVVWTKNIDDSSGLAGCSGYDIDGDAALEVLYADQGTFYIWDGATGTERYSNGSHNSGTIFEYPTVADVDNDGSAEIVISSNYGSGGLKGITVFGHGGDGWPKSGTTWHVHDFAVTNINPDGSVPKSPDPSWTKYNVFRARPAVDDPSTADLTIGITEVCVAHCELGPVKVALTVENQGGADVEAGVPWALYSVDNENTLISQGTLPAVAAGERLTGWEVIIAPEDVGRGGLLAVVDDDGTGGETVGECDETNNESWYVDWPC